MKALRASLIGVALAFAVLAFAGCGLEDPEPTDAMVEEAKADATEKGFNVTSYFAQPDSEFDVYDDKDTGYVRLNVVFGTEGCIGVLEYHEDDTIVLEVERAVLGTQDEVLKLTIFDPTAEVLAQNAALKDCFVAN